MICCAADCWPRCPTLRSVRCVEDVLHTIDHRFRLEIINPVQTKVYKFAANVVARSIVGQSRSTIDPQAWVRDGAIVVVDVAKEQVGADIAAMLGGTLGNLVAIALASKRRSQRTS